MAIRADRLQELRRARGLTVRALAAAANVRPQTLYDIEAGKEVNPRIDTLTRLARCLGVEPGYLIDTRDAEESEIGAAVTRSA